MKTDNIKLLMGLLLIQMMINKFNYKSLFTTIMFIYGEIFALELGYDMMSFINSIKNKLILPLSPFDEYGHRTSSDERDNPE
tara:strand:+ start:70 stop:315 length:246 start_codon:yes stop_codon:yes gene_type:complete